MWIPVVVDRGYDARMTDVAGLAGSGGPTVDPADVERGRQRRRSTAPMLAAAVVALVVVLAVAFAALIRLGAGDATRMSELFLIAMATAATAVVFVVAARRRPRWEGDAVALWGVDRTTRRTVDGVLRTGERGDDRVHALALASARANLRVPVAFFLLPILGAVVLLAGIVVVLVAGDTMVALPYLAAAVTQGVLAAVLLFVRQRARRYLERYDAVPSPASPDPAA
jgi:uncharacterized membrane protein